MKIVIAGGSGFIGQALTARLLSAGDEVIWLSRSGKTAPAFQGKVKSLNWDAKSLGTWTAALEGADAVVNLCGESIAAKKWDDAQKAVLRSSRIEPAKTLVQAMQGTMLKPKAFISMSGIGYYGAVAGEKEITEDAPKGRGFLAELCGEWEDYAGQAGKSGVRVAIPRMGVVLGEKGALQKMMKPFRFFAGGPLGSGQQWFPWIHVQDAAAGIIFAIKNDYLKGPFNLCSPYTVRMNDFCTTLGRVMNRPSWLPVPAGLLKNLMGEMSEMLLEGPRAVPKKIMRAGFKFRFAFLESALISIFNTELWKP